MGGECIPGTSTYYHQHHHFPHPGPDGMPEEEWCDYGVPGLGVGFKGTDGLSPFFPMLAFTLFLILILLILGMDPT